MKPNKYPQGETTAAEVKAPRETIKVRALQAGYVANVYRAAGDVFVLSPIESPVLEMKDGEMKSVVDEDGTAKMRVIPAQQQFSRHWMEVVSEAVPEKITTARTLMAQETEAINGGPEGVE